MVDSSKGEMCVEVSNSLVELGTVDKRGHVDEVIFI